MQHKNVSFVRFSQLLGEVQRSVPEPVNEDEEEKMNAKETLFWTRVKLLRSLERELRNHQGSIRRAAGTAEIETYLQREKHLLESIGQVNASLSN